MDRRVPVAGSETASLPPLCEEILSKLKLLELCPALLAAASLRLPRAEAREALAVLAVALEADAAEADACSPSAEGVLLPLPALAEAVSSRDRALKGAEATAELVLTSLVPRQPPMLERVIPSEMPLVARALDGKVTTAKANRSRHSIHCARREAATCASTLRGLLL